jgi:predicted metal-binding membrane protein
VRLPILAVSAAAWTVLLSSAHLHSALAHMALMTAAMMLPLVAAPVGHIHDRSFAARRPRAIFLFTSSYLAVWMLAGLLLLSAAAIVPATAAAALVIIWHCSPIRQRCLNRGHNHPALAAFGGAAERAVVRFGVTHALWCVGSCWALMLLSLAVPFGHLTAMAVVSLWMLSERIEPLRRPRWRFQFPRKATRAVLFFALESFSTRSGTPYPFPGEPSPNASIRSARKRTSTA